MANYTGVARSYAFEVRDEKAFLEWVGTLPGVVADHGTQPGTFVLLAGGTSGTGSSGWPDYRSPAEDFRRDEIDLPVELSGHLVPGSVAVVEEVGFLKFRCLVGQATAEATAVNHLGQTITVKIDDVYERAKQAGWARRIPLAID